MTNQNYIDLIIKTGVDILNSIKSRSLEEIVNNDDIKDALIYRFQRLSRVSRALNKKFPNDYVKAGLKEIDYPEEFFAYDNEDNSVPVIYDISKSKLESLIKRVKSLSIIA